MHLGLPDARYATPAQRANFYDTLLDRVRVLPGVDAAGFVSVVPGQGYAMDSTFSIVEHPPLPQSVEPPKRDFCSVCGVTQTTKLNS
jgi:hypothetical protein